MGDRFALVCCSFVFCISFHIFQVLGIMIVSSVVLVESVSLDESGIITLGTAKFELGLYPKAWSRRATDMGNMSMAITT